MKKIATIDINSYGNLETLYTDEINLYDIGTIKNVKRASHVIFNEQTQKWDVVTTNDKTVIFSYANRQIAIEKEIELLSPGSQYHEHPKTNRTGI